MGNQMTTQNSRTDVVVRHALRERMDDIQKALGKAIPAEQWLAVAMSTLGDDKLLKCDPASILRAMYTCATMGATPASSVTPQVQRRVALIPRGRECTVMPEARYFQELFNRHPDVKRATAHLVAKEDTFEWDGTAHQMVEHTYDPFRKLTRENIVGGYVRFSMKDGATEYHLVDRDRIDTAESCAQTKNIWRNHFAQMALKTLWRDAAARGAVVFNAVSDTGRHLAKTVEVFDATAGPPVIDAEAHQRAIEQRKQEVAAENAAHASRVDAIRQAKTTVIDAEPAPGLDMPAWAADAGIEAVWLRERCQVRDLMPEALDPVETIADWREACAAEAAA